MNIQCSETFKTIFNVKLTTFLEKQGYNFTRYACFTNNTFLNNSTLYRCLVICHLFQLLLQPWRHNVNFFVLQWRDQHSLGGSIYCPCFLSIIIALLIVTLCANHEPCWNQSQVYGGCSPHLNTTSPCIKAGLLLMPYRFFFAHILFVLYWLRSSKFFTMEDEEQFSSITTWSGLSPAKTSWSREATWLLRHPVSRHNKISESIILMLPWGSVD